MAFTPIYFISATIANDLMAIEALKERVKLLPVTPSLLRSLRLSAKYQSAHYSTQIEGNRLTQREVEQVLADNKKIAGRERDENEIKGYFAALERFEKQIDVPLSEKTIQTLHALVEGGGKERVKPSRYRDGQNVIRESIGGRIVYMPPEAKDVPTLMSELVLWINSQTQLPAPIVSAIAHYQFATIHPYYDGNGRTARLLATLILHKGGYDLKGIYSLDEYYAKDLESYYKEIAKGDSHNYYFGRKEADITSWIGYFVRGIRESFESVERLAKAKGEDSDWAATLKTLTPKRRRVLTLFDQKEYITAKDVAVLFGFTDRAARSLCKQMADDGFLRAFGSNKDRSYAINESFEERLRRDK
jgi:Fic family protein